MWQEGRELRGGGRRTTAADGNFDLTFVSLEAGKNDAFAGTATISANFTLGANGATYSGPFTVTVEAGRHVVFSAKGTVQARGIMVAPL
jgi:hypothetical protein